MDECKPLLTGLPHGALLEHVTVVSGRGGKTGLPDMYFGNASIGVCTGRLTVGQYDNVKDVRQGLTLVHFSAQPEPFPIQNTP